MQRYTFYFLVALITFGISSFIVFNLFISLPDEVNQSTKFEMTEINGKWKFIPVKEFTPQKPDEAYDKPKKKERQKPFCRDKKLLPVWNLLLNDEYFRERSGLLFDEPNCADMFEVLEFDLNRDGRKELLLRGKSSSLCGGTGNCGFWIFEKKGRKYRKLLTDSDFVDITEMGGQIKKSRTKGYLNIITKGHITAGNTRYSTYKFNGRRYKESKCLVDAYISGTSDNPKGEFINCKKFYKRWENE